MEWLVCIPDQGGEEVPAENVEDAGSCWGGLEVADAVPGGHR